MIYRSEKNIFFFLEYIKTFVYLYQLTTTKKHAMKVSSLTSKLSKLNIAFVILENNGYNKDVQFSINGLNFKAGFIEGQELIYDYCAEFDFEQDFQETRRRFFSNFKQLLKYANS